MPENLSKTDLINHLVGAQERGERPVAPGARLRGTDLRGTDLRGADLRDADLRGADLRGANLRWSDLRGTDLREANLRGANLREANLDTWERGVDGYARRRTPAASGQTAATDGDSDGEPS